MINMKTTTAANIFILLISFADVVNSAESSESAATSFEGALSYHMYSNGDGWCVESNFVGTGTILSLIPMEQSNTFCETDIRDLTPLGFSSTLSFDPTVNKIHLSCSPINDIVHFEFISCLDTDCNACASSRAAKGTTKLRNFAEKNNNVSDCLYGWPSVPLDGENNTVVRGGNIVIGYRAFDDAMDAPAQEELTTSEKELIAKLGLQWSPRASQVETFFNVLIKNSCLAEIDYSSEGGDEWNACKRWQYTLVFKVCTDIHSGYSVAVHDCIALGTRQSFNDCSYEYIFSTYFIQFYARND